MVKQIMIVAMSAEGAALCDRTIYEEAAALLDRHAHPEVMECADFCTPADRGSLCSPRGR